MNKHEKNSDRVINAYENEQKLIAYNKIKEDKVLYDKAVSQFIEISYKDSKKPNRKIVVR